MSTELTDAQRASRGNFSLTRLRNPYRGKTIIAAHRTSTSYIY